MARMIAGIHPLLKAKGYRRRKGQDQDERAFELPQQKAQGAQARRILDAVGAHGGKLRSRPLRRESPKSRTQRRRQCGSILVPVARVTRHVCHGLPPASGMGRCHAQTQSHHGSGQRADPGRQRHGKRTPNTPTTNAEWDISSTIASGISAPTAEVAAEVSAAWFGRAFVT